ncbi:MAG: hypothetical protein ACREUG_17050 [Steroidobacteraceae bacterium]
MNMLALAFAAIALLAVIAAQDYLWAPLRNETISSGLEGPYHWWLDGAYIVLAAALCMGFTGRPLTEAFAVVTAIALVLSGVANTAYRWVDQVTGGKHEQLHLAFTAVVFLGAAGVELTADRGALWWLSLANGVVPAALWGLTSRKDYAEKIGVLLLCLWLIAWTL